MQRFIGAFWKKRLLDEGANETVTKCNGLKMRAEGGKIASNARKELESKAGKKNNCQRKAVSNEGQDIMTHAKSNSPADARRASLWLGAKGLSLLGDALFQVALPLLVFHKTGSSRLMGYTVATELTAYTIFALIGGHLSDRYPLRPLIVGLDITRFALLAGLLIVLQSHFSYATLLFLTFVLSMLSAVYNVAYDTFAVHAFSGRLLERVLTFNQALDSLANVAGFALAGVLLTFAPLETCLWIDAVSFLLPPVALWLFPPFQRASAETQPGSGGWKGLFAGFSFSWRLPVLRHTLTLAMLGNVLSAIWSANALVLMKTRWHLADNEIGPFQAALSLGFIAGVSLFGYALRTRRLTPAQTLVLGQILQAGLFALLAFNWPLAIVIPLAVLYTAAQAGHSVPSALIRKDHTPKAVYGQTLAAARVLSRLTVPVAMYLSVALSSWVSYSTLFLTTAGFVLVLSWPSMRRLRQDVQATSSVCSIASIPN